MEAVKSSTICPVCGYDLGFVPWDSHEMCPSCGMQFGYYDSTSGGPERQQQLYAEWCQRWIDEGMPWNGEGQPRPANWNPAAQLRRLG
jgi:hypothetical protein